MSMRYFENDLELGSIYSAFDGALIGFKSTTEAENGETAIFLIYDIENSRCSIAYMPFVINGGGVFKKVKDEVAIHEKIYSFFEEYRRRCRSANSDKELWYHHYYKNFGVYANKIPHSECRFCGKIFIKSQTVSVITEDGYKDLEICSSCYEHEVSSCNICGNSFYNSDGEISRDGRMLCPKCKKRHFVLPYHRNYPKLKFFGNSTEDNPQPYLGIELEVDEGGESNSEVEKILKIINANDMFAYCSHDGSLSNGFEIITQPATLTYHNSIKHVYKSVFETLLKDGYVSHDSTTCGLHVHFNRDFYAGDEELYITRLLYIIDKFWDDVVRVSRRNQRRMDRYTRKIDIPTDSYIHRANKTGNHDYHYYAVNLTNESTIEFRMFRGTLKVDTFLATLQFVNNCIVAAKTKTAEEIQQMKFEELITGRTLTSYWRKRKGLSDTEE